MKKNLGISLIIFIIFLACSCVTQNKSAQKDDLPTAQNDTVRIANYSLEYEIIIIEPGFNAWLVTQPPRSYRGQAGMDISNDFKVIQYNLGANQPLQFDPNLYILPIDYNARVDYGYEVTYMLFNYFRFFEQRYNQRL